MSELIKTPVRYEHHDSLHGHGVWRDANGTYLFEDFGNHLNELGVVNVLTDEQLVERNNFIAQCINDHEALLRIEAAAETVQDLYLEGRKDEAAAALPGELIDTVTLVGPADRVRDRIAIYRDAGVGTLMIAPMAWTFEDKLAQLRAVAELAE